MDTQDLKSMVRDVVRQMVNSSDIPGKTANNALDHFEAPDIGAGDLKDIFYVQNPQNRAAYLEMKQATPARIGVGRAGPRQNTKTMLRFRADHAAAMDAVFGDVSEELIQDMGLLPLQSTAPGKAEFLMDPALGRTLDDAGVALVKEKCAKSPQVQIIVSDGLSSTSVEANIRDVLPALMQGLKGNGLTAGTPVFVKYGRVGVMDHIAELVGSSVTINLLGERPGLVTDESLSAYMTYKGFVGMPESSRSVVSNIYHGGTAPSEAGAHIADLAKRILDSKMSGMELK